MIRRCCYLTDHESWLADVERAYLYQFNEVFQTIHASPQNMYMLHGGTASEYSTSTRKTQFVSQSYGRFLHISKFSKYANTLCQISSTVPNSFDINRLTWHMFRSRK